MIRRRRCEEAGRQEGREAGRSGKGRAGKEREGMGSGREGKNGSKLSAVSFSFFFLEISEQDCSHCNCNHMLFSESVFFSIRVSTGSETICGCSCSG